MQAALKAHWVAALRSGEFEQGHERLYREDGYGNGTYCCLGVLCVEAGMDKLDIWQRGTLGTIGKMQFLGADPDTELFRNTTAYSQADNIETTLISLNDSQGNDFNAIADWIENNVEAT